ncbi:MAG: diadenylate cyclase CdaA [Candidatus Alcyoniella australis]|nr:diadenylate cyclase CdaA [Candidatus Alcyoniella australis]
MLRNAPLLVAQASPTPAAAGEAVATPLDGSTAISRAIQAPGEGSFLQDLTFADLAGGLVTVVDILLVAYVIYRLILIVKGTRATQILLGLALLLVVQWVAIKLEMKVVNFILASFLTNFILVIVVLFQSEIRRALARVGKAPFFGSHEMQSTELVSELVQTVSTLANRRIGAIIAIERDTGLKEYIDDAVKMDAAVNKDLLTAIFMPSSPIHDGAVVIRSGRIVAAGTFFPLATDIEIEKDLGTRHRAALGISEESDSVVIVVSEERGEATVVVDGTLRPVTSPEDLRMMLSNMIG